jgi:heptosyltransferase-2/heptosyltransferase-3
MVLVTALIRDLSRSFASDVDIVTSGPWSEPLLRGQPGVGEILCVRSRKAPYWLSLDQRRVVRRLLARGVGPTWFCDGNDAARRMLSRVGIPEHFIVDVKDHPLLAGEHATQQWHRLARIMPAAWAARGEPPPDDARGAGGAVLTVSDAQRIELVEWLETRGLDSLRLLAIQIGNKRTMRRGLRRLSVNHKYWPVDRWAVVLQHLRRRHPQHAIVLLGAAPEFRLNQELAAAARIDGLYNLADALCVPRLVALLARAEGLVTVDSGPAHVAAAVGCPQVVLFGKASTTLYRPWGTGADVRVITGRSGDELSMLGITVQQVTAAWDGLDLRDTLAPQRCAVLDEFLTQDTGGAPNYRGDGAGGG